MASTSTNEQFNSRETKVRNRAASNTPANLSQADNRIPDSVVAERKREKCAGYNVVVGSDYAVSRYQDAGALADEAEILSSYFYPNNRRRCGIKNFLSAELGPLYRRGFV